MSLTICFCICNRNLGCKFLYNCLAYFSGLLYIYQHPLLSTNETNEEWWKKVMVWYDVSDIHNARLWSHSFLYVCFGLARIDTCMGYLQSDLLWSPLWSLIYIYAYIHPNIEHKNMQLTQICYHLILMVLVHVAWCEFEDQIGILSTTSYQGEPMSLVWPTYCNAMVLGIWGSNGRKEWGQQLCPSFNFLNR